METDLSEAPTYQQQGVSGSSTTHISGRCVTRSNESNLQTWAPQEEAPVHRVRITERKAGKVDKLWRSGTACAQFRILVGGMALLRSIRLIAAGRALAGMTQADLAGAAGISLSVLQAVEHGKSDPKLSTLLAVIDALKAQGVELLANSDSVAWGVYVVPGSPAAAGGRPQPEMGEAPAPKRRGRPPGKSSAMPR